MHIKCKKRHDRAGIEPDISTRNCNFNAEACGLSDSSIMSKIY